MTEYQTFGQLCADKFAVEEYLNQKKSDKSDEIACLREEREELCQKKAQRIDDFIKDTTDWRKVLAVEIARNLCINKKDFDTLDWGAKEYFLTQARTALAVAEPVIREECARIAEGELLHFPKLTKAGKGYNQACNEVAAAIREGKHD